MGSDNLFHKRKMKKIASLRREQSKYEPYDVVLIVCEGGKSEPNYFQELRDEFNLSTANIRIVGDQCGSSPRNIVKYAISEYRKTKRYNRIFCVFDKDRHPTYNEALNRIRNTKLSKGDTIQAITSVPCFEVWVLLHFKYTSKPFASRGVNDSICETVLKELKLPHHLPAYEKGTDHLFSILKERLPDAMRHAGRLAAHCVAADTDNPSTQVHQLVEYLQNLKRKN